MLNWLSFLTYAFVTAFTPGPNNIMSMANGSRLGFKRAFPFNLGILCGFTIVISLCSIFCSLLTVYLPVVQTAMLVIGAAYMLYLAWVIFRSTGNIGEKHLYDGFWAGLLLQFVNPKLYLYSIVSLEVYILPYYSGNISAIAGFGLLLGVIAFSSTMCWSAFGSQFRKLFTQRARLVNTVMALLLVYCAVSLFL